MGLVTPKEISLVTLATTVGAPNSSTLGEARSLLLRWAKLTPV